MAEISTVRAENNPVVSSLTRSGDEQRKRTTSVFSAEIDDLDMADYLAMSATTRGAYRKSLGKPEALTRAVTHQLAKDLAEPIGELGRKLGNCESEHDAATVIHEVRDSFLPKQAREMIRQSIAKSIMAGQMAVHAYDAGSAISFSADRPFLQKPWDDAIAEFKKQPFYNEKTFERIIAMAQERGAVFDSSMIEQIQAKVRALVTQAMIEGTSFKEFGASISDFSTSLGIDPPNPSYIQMAFRTNINSGYSAGRKEAIVELKNERPFWQFLTVADGNVRDTHATLHRAVFRVGNPDTDRLMPTLDYNCRCVSVSVKDPGRFTVYDNSSKFVAAINPEFSK
jgi:SPP1 gp7 family putative phage head morphogenesis protein